MAEQFHDKLKEKVDEFAHLIYKVTKKFPKEELYGTVSQLRRAAISVVLNYVEGFARIRPLVKINFFEMSYGSLQESKYLLEFAADEKWIDNDEFNHARNLGEEIGAMLWKTIENLRKN